MQIPWLGQWLNRAGQLTRAFLVFVAMVLGGHGLQAQAQPASSAQGLLAVPALTNRVIDQTQTLSAADIQNIQAQLLGIETNLGSQLVVLMVPTTQPEDIAQYAFRVADQWKIGRQGVGDGVLLLVAKNDRKVRIEVAKDLEGAIPDLAAKQIINNALMPAFRQGDFAGGISQAIVQLSARISKENLPSPGAAKTSLSNHLSFENMALILFIGVPLIGSFLIGLFGRKLGSVVTGLAIGGLGWWITASILIGLVAALVAAVFAGALGSSGRSIGSAGWPGGGGGWSGGGGGGFSSGGGGDFGGGGASGSW